MPTRRHILAGTGAVGLAAGLAAGPGAAQPAPLAGKTFLITGASSGFGNLGALLYARQGARVFATMRNLPRSEAETLRKTAEAEKLNIEILELDVLSDSQVAAAVAEAERRNGGPLDVLVNNAGVVIRGPVEVQDLEAVKLAFDTNVFGYQRTARAVLPGMRQRKAGLIVNVSSQAGRLISPGMGVYSSTKFAVEAMSEQMAYELAPHGVEVVLIQPGGYGTKVGENSHRYTSAVAARAEPSHTAGYPEMVAGMSTPMGGGRPPPPGMPDPMDVPRAIAEIAAMPAGRRPLRRPVHPGPKPQVAINKVCADTQLAVLGATPYAPWAKAVLD